MKVENGLSYAIIIMLSVLLVTVATFVLAAILEENGGFLANLAQFMAAFLTLLSVGTVAIMIVYAFRILMRQPDDVSPDAKSRAPIYRERVDGAIIYQNLGAFEGRTMVVYRPDQTPPRVQCELGSQRLAFQEPTFDLSDVICCEGSLDSFLEQRGGNT